MKSVKAVHVTIMIEDCSMSFRSHMLTFHR